MPSPKRRLTEAEQEKRRKAALHFRQQGAELVANLIDAGDISAAARALDKFLERRLAEPVKLAETAIRRPDIEIKDDQPRQAERAIASAASLVQQLATTLTSTRALQNAVRANEHRSQILAFMRTKWAEIGSNDRHFGLADNRNYDVEVSAPCLRDIGLLKFRFEQREFQPPELGVVLIGTGEATSQCWLDRSGILRSRGQLEALVPDGHQLLLNLAAVMYYFDLVIPRRDTTRSSTARIDALPLDTTSDRVRYDSAAKILPRRVGGVRSRDLSVPIEYQRAAAFVDPFRRRLPPGQSPSFLKVVEADQFGINIQGPGHPAVKYTFVRGHVRGREGDPPEYRYRHDYRAARTFEAILDAIGVS